MWICIWECLFSAKLLMFQHWVGAKDWFDKAVWHRDSVCYIYVNLITHRSTFYNY